MEKTYIRMTSTANDNTRACIDRGAQGTERGEQRDSNTEGAKLNIVFDIASLSPFSYAFSSFLLRVILKDKRHHRGPDQL